jgi:hypothetical protein
MIRDGDLVFEVGSGKGYLCGLLLTVAAYHGIDIVAWHRKQPPRVLEANDLPRVTTCTWAQVISTNCSARPNRSQS